MKKRKFILAISIFIVCMTSLAIYITTSKIHTKTHSTSKIKETINNESINEEPTKLQSLLSKKEVKVLETKDLVLIGKLLSDEYLCLYNELDPSMKSELRIYNNDLSKCNYTIKQKDNNKRIYSACISKNNIFFVESSNNEYKDEWVLYRCNLDDRLICKIDESNCKVDELSLKYPSESCPELQCDDNYVIWNTFEKNITNDYKAVVKLYDIKNSICKTIDASDIHTPSDTRFNLCSVSNGYALYALHAINKSETALSASIYLLNLSTGEKKEITNIERACPIGIVYPKIMYSVISDVHIYNAETGKDEIIPSQSAEKWQFTFNNEYMTCVQNTRNKIPIFSLKHNKFFTLTESKEILYSKIDKNILYWKIQSQPNKLFYINLE